ncbi:MAG: alpha/beta hydrolase [Pigmentiphaga sp.]|uniref:alpha/beta fold hydrolase n=1 Tax=Pigmentiphaga sp. TaxID=1977564 RepID=UPI0029A06402|nr:alpha/beta hydrolase [Pigmentiphaga sp.]MDX3907278.1 alpha/beta hydrolase [Pigmentiphaga sp.]
MELGTNIDVHGVTMHVRRTGTGRKVVFLHGAGGIRSWGPAFRSLAERYELVVPDHPGFGLSGDAARVRTVGDVAMCYLDLFDQLVGTSGGIHLVGHSIGGWIAAELAVRNCSHIRSLSLIAPAGVAASGVETGDVFIWNDEELLANSYHDPACIESARASAATADADIAIRNKVAFARLAWSPRLHNPGLKHWLHRISVPTQLIWGTEDKILPPALADEWQRGLGFERIDLIPDCGHMPLVERPGETVELLSSFIDGVQA